MSKETVELAFPVPNPDFQTFQPETIQELKRIMSGMTLREHFAGLAMQGICSHSDTWGLTVPQIASQAYKMADAMLAARKE